MDTTTLVGFLCTCLGGYFAIMNPIANTPVFISLTQGDDVATKRAVARNSLLFAFVLIAVLSFAGNFIFKLFGITQPALQITGGIIIFI
ncbi:MAG: MarC family protein, partial [Methanophagales archaeon]|nr:MarC family protein [Methanophagales archaeon]